MIDLNIISQELKKYKEAKERTSDGPWINVKDGEGGFVVVHSGKNDEKHDVCYSAVTENFQELNDMNFIETAKNTPLEDYCEQLLQEIRILKNE